MKRILEVAGAAVLVIGIYAFHGQVSETRTELKEEQECLVNAKAGEETQKCFDLMDSHKKP